MYLTVEKNASNMTEQLQQIKQYMSQSGDNKNAAKIDQLVKKINTKQMFIAFCGHFSAGKSSLINELCGHSLLPSSPIPTSANIVSITNGEPAAYITRRSETDTLNQNGTKIEAVPIDELQTHCVNGEHIETVEIRYPIPFLGDHIALLDTPGIDSTDDAHRMATESALHLADVVFYVMDYNHVQSELNFSFTKMVQDWGKPVYLIVNQIDKHHDRELTFAEYKSEVKKAFANWNIHPHGLLFTTLKEPAYPENEYGKLKWLLQQLTERTPELRRLNVEKSTLHLIEQHCDFEFAKHEAEKAKYEQVWNDASEGNGESGGIAVQYKKLQQKLEEALQWSDRIRSDLRKEIAAISENANLTPAQTRDLVHEFLESRKSGFKVGLFFSANKTAAEVEKRTAALFEDFKDKIHAHLDWHLRDLLRKSCENVHIDPEIMVSQLDQVKSEITAEWLAARVNGGAVFSNEYTMTFSKQIAEEVKAMYRKEAFELADAIAKAAEAQAERKAQALLIETEELSSVVEAKNKLDDLERKEQQYAHRLESLMQLSELDLLSVLPDLINAPAISPEAPLLESAPSPDLSLALNGAQPVVQEKDRRRELEATQAPASTISQQGLRNKLTSTSDRLESAAKMLENIPSMASICRSMNEKAKRLRNNTFTIALFGAFSAGKSSFANALMGERVLPVSPNPTTAAINKIVPPNEQWPHGTAKVKMKSIQSITDDVLFSLQALGYSGHDMSDALRTIASLSPEQISGKGKPHYTFLKAVQSGWSESQQTLGAEIKADMELFQAYVADEKKSCFVEFVELHYSSPLTDQGIILVDTPGADSINARHTGVAFNYIKNADAILFITYYNHAFSQADREFLLQLGRVKDSFELDKMFFILNASDLASSETELQAVVNHLETNLLQYGIRHPRIYPVSSLLALDARAAGQPEQAVQSGIVSFENEFIRFTFDELADMAVNSAQNELKRSAGLLQQWMESAQQGEEERHRKLMALKQSVAIVQEHLNSDQFVSEHQWIAQEIKELLYYVKQRIFFRFGEFYNAAFNPSVLRDDVKDIKTALRAAWQDLISLIAYDLSQELLATTLRVEQYMDKSAQKYYEGLLQYINLELPTYEGEDYSSVKFETPNVEENLEEAQMDEKLLYSSFKSAKAFFEGQGKSKLKEELEKRLLPQVSSYLDRHALMLETHYVSQYDAQINDLLTNQKSSIQEHSEGLFAALEMRVDMEDIEHRLKSIQQWIR